MNVKLIALATAIALGVPAAGAESRTPETGISLDAASGWRATHCQQRKDFSQEPTDFPLARTAIQHVLCAHDSHKIMLTFADDRLILIETRGEIEHLVPQTDPAAQLQHFDVYPEIATIHDRNADRLLQLDSLHDANLLLFWSNPAWSGNTPLANEGAQWNLPGDIAFGSGIAETEMALEGRCLMTQVRPIDEVWLLTAPAEQVQVDCYGYDIAGYPRTIELVFGDGRLEQMWILIGDADISRARAHFSALYGPPTEETERYIVYNDWAFAIRKDVPEFLLGSAELQAIWRQQGN